MNWETRAKDMCCKCRSVKAPYGYTLPAFAWYVDQTVGGAVSTGTHGSTMKYGSLSSQARFHTASSVLPCASLFTQERGLHVQLAIAVAVAIPQLWKECVVE